MTPSQDLAAAIRLAMSKGGQPTELLMNSDDAIALGADPAQCEAPCAYDDCPIREERHFHARKAR